MTYHSPSEERRWHLELHERVLLLRLLGGGLLVSVSVGSVSVDRLLVALGRLRRVGVLDRGVCVGLIGARTGELLDLGGVGGGLGRGVGPRGGGEREGVVKVLVRLFGGGGLIAHRRESAFLAAWD